MPISDRRPFGRVSGFASLVLALGKVPAWLATPARSPRARQIERAFFDQIARGFGIKVAGRGQPSLVPGTLFITNHISWADIPVLASIIDADFVAKADIARWPILGPLAQRLNPVFVARGMRCRTHHQVDAIRARLASGRSVILCAEGTTSDASGILPFCSSLFAAADAAALIQPLALRYLALDGSELSSTRMREVAWIGDDDLLSGAARVARQRTLALVDFLEPVCAIPNRKIFAGATRALIEAAYAAAPNLSR